MRVRREPREARSNLSTVPRGAAAVRWGVALGISLVLIGTVPAADGSGVVPPAGVPSTSTAAPTTVPTTTSVSPRAGDVGVAPTVHELSIPTVVPSDRDAVEAKAGSRQAVTADAAVPANTRTSAAALPLVAHVQSPVSGGFSMLGVTWRHTGSGADTPATRPVVAVRTREGGTWSSWTTLHVDPEEGPAADEDSAVRDGTEPMFVGNADTVEVDVYSTSGKAPAGLSVSAIDPGRVASDATAAATNAVGKRSATTSSSKSTAASASDGYPRMPRIVTRRGWGADERLGDQCWSPRYGRTFKVVFVHHTAGSNSYTRRESPGIVRGIYAYHTQSRGWCDIGYNFLVDKYGTVYEGRAGGIRRSVRGAHAGDYNVNSTGISLMGEFTNTMPSLAMRRALTTLVSWRLGVAYHMGRGATRLNGKVFQRISGHRDAMSTACPGQRVYDWLPTLRRRVNARLSNFSSAIERHWLKLGGTQSYLGPVRVGEVAARGGRHTTFAHGRSYVKDGHFRTYRPGKMLAAYLKVGEVNGVLGYPTGRVHSGPSGRFADFEGGVLYLSKGVGPRVLKRGPILHRYLKLDGPGGRLGFPRTWIRSTRKGSYASFRHGRITYDDSTDKTTVTFE